jgi:hypothetical protein
MSPNDNSCLVKGIQALQTWTKNSTVRSVGKRKVDKPIDPGQVRKAHSTKRHPTLVHLECVEITPIFPKKIDD